MKKSYKHDQLSTRVCNASSSCTTRIKQRLVELKDATVCYACHCLMERKRGHFINATVQERIQQGFFARTSSKE